MGVKRTVSYKTWCKAGGIKEPLAKAVQQHTEGAGFVDYLSNPGNAVTDNRPNELKP